MGSTLFVANLAEDVTTADLRARFALEGVVHGAEVMADPTTGRSKEFGYVRMKTGQGAADAIRALNRQAYRGRSLIVRWGFDGN